MKYFSGFSLENEVTLFKDFIVDTDTTIVGFSYGAQQAIDYAYTYTKRIDRIILLSPAFFQTQKASFIRAQLRYFEANKDAYVSQFLQNVMYPSNTTIDHYLNIGTTKELESLLCYKWDKQKITTLLERGITIEVFMGEKDKIVDTNEASKFFQNTTNYIIKDAGHLLRSKHD